MEFKYLWPGTYAITKGGLKALEADINNNTNNYNLGVLYNGALSDDPEIKAEATNRWAWLPNDKRLYTIDELKEIYEKLESMNEEPKDESAPIINKGNELFLLHSNKTQEREFGQVTRQKDRMFYKPTANFLYCREVLEPVIAMVEEKIEKHKAELNG